VGASWVRKNILEKYPDAPLSVYAVWVTQLGATRGDIEPDLFGDERVTSYWDPDGLVGEAIADDVEAYGSVVWDVYALYGTDARWDARPTGLTDWGAPVIADSDRLGQRVEALATS
jgi:hypothetical protein